MYKIHFSCRSPSMQQRGSEAAGQRGTNQDSDRILQIQILPLHLAPSNNASSRGEEDIVASAKSAGRPSLTHTHTHTQFFVLFPGGEHGRYLLIIT